mmetsp:Transcript_20853/g.60704  ORF Transcript_20853/g.60704 Transcript_20853/m.60704 type:complete len:101 (-) Transcript_20853:309-611(-)
MKVFFTEDMSTWKRNKRRDYLSANGTLRTVRINLGPETRTIAPFPWTFVESFAKRARGARVPQQMIGSMRKHVEFRDRRTICNMLQPLSSAASAITYPPW